MRRRWCDLDISTDQGVPLLGHWLCSTLFLTASGAGNRYIGGINPPVHYTYVPIEGDGRGGAMGK